MVNAEMTLDATDSTADEPAPPGFTSRAGKAIVKRRALAISVALAAIQILVPLGFMAVIFTAVIEGVGAPSIDVAQGAFWRGSLWLVERSPLRFRGPDSTKQESVRVLRWSPAEGGAPQYAKLPAVDEPFVLAAGGALWVVGRDRCVVMERDRLDAVALTPHLARYLSHPFELDGKPAIVAATDWVSPPALFVLERNGAWKPDARVEVGTEQDAEPRGVAMVVPDGGRLRVFAAAEKGIAHRDDASGFTDVPLARWETLPAGEGVPVAWTIGRVGGEIAAFSVRRDGLSLAVEVTRLGTYRNWTRPAQLDLGDLADLSVYDGARAGRYWIVGKTADGGVTVYELEGDEVVVSTRIAEGAMDSAQRLNAASAWCTVVATAVTPALLLLALAGALRRHRTGVVELEGRSVRLASLPRRCAAATVDLIIAGGPFAAAYTVFLFSFSGTGGAASGDQVRQLAWLGATCLWSLAATLALSFAEGRTGLTPGNRIAGIRTMRLDLGNPGFGRALVRNLIVLVDAAFGFALAIVLIALTPNQQRLGDLAAKTVVVHLQRNRHEKFVF